MPERIAFGPTIVTLDDPEFVRGIGSGLESLQQETQRQFVPALSISASAIRDLLVETLIDEEHGEQPASNTFRAGFAFGRLCGLLYPDLDEVDQSLSWIEALIQRSSKKIPSDCLAHPT